QQPGTLSKSVHYFPSRGLTYLDKAIMNDNGQALQRADLSLFEDNRSKYPPGQLVRYAGLFVAWSLDGRQIVASGEDRAALKQGLQAAGIAADQVVFDYIDPPDLAMLG